MLQLTHPSLGRIIATNTNESRSMNPRLRKVWALIAVLCSFVANFDTARASDTTNAELKMLLRSLQGEYPSINYKGLTRDATGRIIEARIGYTNLTDSNLFLLSKINSIQSLWMRGGPSKKYISTEDLSSLHKLTNLIELHAGCFLAYWKPGVFEQICELRGLKKLNLYYSFPAAAENYARLAQLTNLEELRITGTTNFTLREAHVLTNLTRLKNLSVQLNGLPSTDTNFFGTLHHLTNLQVTFYSR